MVRMVERVDRGVKFGDDDDDVSNDEVADSESSPPTADDREDIILLLVLYLCGEREVDAIDGDCGLPFRRGVLDVECEFGRHSLPWLLPLSV